MILHGKHLIKAWTKQQSIVATCSAEPELYAGNRAGTESMGFQAFARDVAGAVPIRLHINSSAALSVASRTVLGKVQQIEVQHLWVQEALEQVDAGELIRLRYEAAHEREIGDVDEARELLLCVGISSLVHVG